MIERVCNAVHAIIGCEYRFALDVVFICFMAGI